MEVHASVNSSKSWLRKNAKRQMTNVSKSEKSDCSQKKITQWRISCRFTHVSNENLSRRRLRSQGGLHYRCAFPEVGAKLVDNNLSRCTRGHLPVRYSRGMGRTHKAEGKTGWMGGANNAPFMISRHYRETHDFGV